MQNFNFEKKGYNKDEVQNTIETLVQDYEQKLSEQKDRIFALKQEVEDLKESLSEYKTKDKNISGALIAAVETAQEIEKNSKNIYELEIKRLRLLYSKWESFLEEMIEKYPQMKDNFDAEFILSSFKQAIDKTMQENFSTMRTQKQENNLRAKEGIQGLLQRMGGATSPKNTYTTSTTTASSTNLPLPKMGASNIADKPTIIKRQENVSTEAIERTRIQNDMLFESKRLGEARSNIKPITNLTLTREDRYNNLVDKYLDANNVESEDFANTAYAKQLTQKEERKKPSYLSYPTPNETGFDLKQALNPTEELAEIMKSFDFFDSDSDE